MDIQHGNYYAITLTVVCLVQMHGYLWLVRYSHVVKKAWNKLYSVGEVANVFSSIQSLGK